MNCRKAILQVSSGLSLVLIVAQALLVVGSWILTAAKPNIHMRSILGSDGLRWLFGTFVDNISTPMLVWMLLLGVALGLLWASGLPRALRSYRKITGYERMALLVVLWEVVAIVVAIVLLAFVPHAVLLSALGTLLPSSFSASAFPMFTFTLIIIAITYGSITGAFRSVAGMFVAMSDGVGALSPLMVLYAIGMEFYCSLVWVFSL